MTIPTPRWTAETEELATDLLMQGYGRLYGRSGAQYDVIRLLNGLADAGVLNPPDIKPNRQYGRRRADGLLLATSLPDPTHYRIIGPWREITDGD